VAVTAKRLGAKKVTMVCLEPRERMPASSEEIARAEEEGIVIMPSWGLSAVASEDGKVSGLELKRCISPWDETGRFNPKYDEDEKTVVAAENILMAVGQTVDLSFLDEKYQIQLSARGLIDVADDTRMTSREGVFAGGDVTTGPATVIGSVASGHRAANGINSYLDVVPVGAYDDGSKFISFYNEGVQNATAIKLREVGSGSRKLDVEDSITPEIDEAVLETRRCMNCGCYTIHPSDVAPALIALRASIVTDRRVIDAGDFFAVRTTGNTVLAGDEIITEIRVPEPSEGVKSAFIKMAFRKSIDFPVVNCAVVVGGEYPRVCLNAVAPTPYRAHLAEKVIAGKVIDETTAEAAGEAAVREATPLIATKYKTQIAKTLVKRALLAAVK
jgi:CO/xanthine dehydrogenase FAD-binding subunit